MFNLETQLTQDVRSEFIGRGRYRILPEAGTDVDAVLTGEVTAVNITPASFNTAQLATRFVITMSARVQLREVEGNKVLWENPGLFFRQEFESRGHAERARSGGVLRAGPERPGAHERRFRQDHRQRDPGSVLKNYN